MQALRLTRHSTGITPVISLETVSIPEILTTGSQQLLVKIAASAIHPSDLLNSKGGFPYTTFPRIPGRDFAGIIVSGPRAGEEVYGTSGFTYAFTADGYHAEYAVVAASAVVRKPKNLSFVQAACIGVPYTTAALVLSKTRAAEGEIILVLGATGAVGSAVVALAKAKGCRVLQAMRSDRGDVNTETDPTLNALDELTSGMGVDVIIDTVGQPGLTNAAILKLAVRGRLGFMSAPKGGASTSLQFDMLDFYRKEKTMVGCNTLLYSPEEAAAQLEDITHGLESGALSFPTGEWTQVALEDGVKGYEQAGQKGAKVVLVM